MHHIPSNSWWAADVAKITSLLHLFFTACMEYVVLSCENTSLDRIMSDLSVSSSSSYYYRVNVIKDEFDN